LITLGLSLTILIAVTIIGFYKHGFVYFSYFLPSGTPLALIPLLVLIELVSYVAKGFSLGIRLAGNIISGHLLLHMISSFIAKMA
jgi:F-type H+-transporting ATPase subunit a